jgi:hypothetical protein
MADGYFAGSYWASGYWGSGYWSQTLTPTIIPEEAKAVYATAPKFPLSPLTVEYLIMYLRLKLNE